MSITCSLNSCKKFSIVGETLGKIEIHTNQEDVIELFPRLALGVHCNPLAITTSLVVGTLASNPPDFQSLCGTSFPIPILETLCSFAFSNENITVIICTYIIFGSNNHC